MGVGDVRAGAGQEEPFPADAVDLVVDNRNLMCAQGLLQVIRDMASLEPGQVMLVLSTDAGARREYPAYADRAGHECLGTTTEGSLFRKVYKTYLRRGRERPASSGIWPRSPAGEGVGPAEI